MTKMVYLQNKTKTRSKNASLLEYGDSNLYIVYKYICINYIIYNLYITQYILG